MLFQNPWKNFCAYLKFFDFLNSKDESFCLKCTKMHVFSLLTYKISAKIHSHKFVHMPIDSINIYARFLKKVFFLEACLCLSMIVWKFEYRAFLNVFYRYTHLSFESIRFIKTKTWNCLINRIIFSSLVLESDLKSNF